MDDFRCYDGQMLKIGGDLNQPIVAYMSGIRDHQPGLFWRSYSRCILGLKESRDVLINQGAFPDYPGEDATYLGVPLDPKNWTDMKVVCSVGQNMAGATRNGGQGRMNKWGTSPYWLVGTWEGLKDIWADSNHIIGLFEDGTVDVDGFYTVFPPGTYPNLDTIKGWTDIDSMFVMTDTANGGIYGLKNDGTVVSVPNTTGYSGYGEFVTGSWTDVIAVYAGRNWACGVKANGSVYGIGRSMSNFTIDVDGGDFILASPKNPEINSSGQCVWFDASAKKLIYQGGYDPFGMGAIFAGWNNVAGGKSVSTRVHVVFENGTMDSTDGTQAFINLVDGAQGGEANCRYLFPNEVSTVAWVREDGSVDIKGSAALNYNGITSWQLW